MAAPANWILHAADPISSGEKPVEEGESDYLLADYQVRVAAVTENYVRISERMVSQDSVDESAQLSIEIDPEHERVLLHDVHVVRKGRKIDKLADSRRSLLNREEELERGLINGRVTLHVILQDVRVGDVLDYSYTVERRDPFGERGYNDWFRTRWSSPLRRYRLRILNLADRPMQVRDHGGLGVPTVVRKGLWVETTWTGKDIAPLASEEKRPAWFYYYPRIEVSEFPDWNAVRAWSLPMYALDRKQSPELQQLITEFKAEPDQGKRIVNALRFVQDDVRYTGLEIGAGAYRPSQPGVVLARRYGDCKDKVFLLVTLLRALGVEAYPALVHSRMGVGVAERAPSPGAFDHVIAKVRFKDHDYWLDATISGQGGGLDTLVQADYGLALVIDGKSNGLEKIATPVAKAPDTHVVETYDLRKGRETAAKFGVKTTYRGAEADSMRVKMRSTKASTLGKDYLDYYRKTYAAIRMISPVVLKDDRAANIFTVEESYEIDSPFEKGKKGKWFFELEAYLVTDRTKAPGMLERTTPMARDFPMHVHHDIVAYLPEGWDIDEEVVKVTDPAFEYRSEVKFRKGRLDLKYDLRSTSDHVKAAAFGKYTKQLAKVHDDAFYTLYDDEDTATSVSVNSKPAREPSQVAILQLLVFALTGILAGVVMVWLVLRFGSRLPPARKDAPEGIDGWLLAPAFLTLMLPVLVINALRILLTDIGGASEFARLGDASKFLRSLQLLSECLLLAVSLPTVWMMLKRKTAYVGGFFLTLALLLWLLTVDILVALLSADRSLLMQSRIVSVCAVAVSALLIVYMCFSQRVRATFTNPSRQPLSPEALNSGAPAPGR
jgi:transglutaminase-like putative cysteine protease